MSAIGRNADIALTIVNVHTWRKDGVIGRGILWIAEELGAVLHTDGETRCACNDLKHQKASDLSHGNPRRTCLRVLIWLKDQVFGLALQMWSC